MKPGRQNAILEIISEQEIETQNQLLEALSQRGIHSTQATLSRDIKELHLVKELGSDGRYHYAVTQRTESDDTLSRLRSIFRESVLSYDVAQNIFVIKTLPGLASAACAAIDAAKVNGLVGSLAGDDTVFLVMRENSHAQDLYHEIEMMF